MDVGVNAVYLTGVLEAPTLRYTAQGMPILSFFVAVGNDERLRVAAYGVEAETLADRLRAGRGVFVEGRLVGFSWEREGVRQTDIELRARRVLELGSVPRYRANGVFISGALEENAQPTPDGTRLLIGIPLRNGDGVAALEVIAKEPLASAVVAFKREQNVLAMGRLLRVRTTSAGQERYAYRLEARDVLVVGAGSTDAAGAADEEIAF